MTGRSGNPYLPLEIRQRIQRFASTPAASRMRLANRQLYALPVPAPVQTLLAAVAALLPYVLQSPGDSTLVITRERPDGSPGQVTIDACQYPAGMVFRLRSLPGPQVITRPGEVQVQVQEVLRMLAGIDNATGLMLRTADDAVVPFVGPDLRPLWDTLSFDAAATNPLWTRLERLLLFIPLSRVINAYKNPRIVLHGYRGDTTIRWDHGSEKYTIGLYKLATIPAVLHHLFEQEVGMDDITIQWGHAMKIRFTGPLYDNPWPAFAG